MTSYVIESAFTGFRTMLIRRETARHYLSFVVLEDAIIQDIWITIVRYQLTYTSMLLISTQMNPTVEQLISIGTDQALIVNRDSLLSPWGNHNTCCNHLRGIVFIRIPSYELESISDLTHCAVTNNGLTTSVEEGACHSIAWKRSLTSTILRKRSGNLIRQTIREYKFCRSDNKPANLSCITLAKWNIDLRIDCIHRLRTR